SKSEHVKVFSRGQRGANRKNGTNETDGTHRTYTSYMSYMSYMSYVSYMSSTSHSSHFNRFPGQPATRTPNNLSKFSVVTCPISLASTSRRLARHLAVSTTRAGSFRFPRNGTGVR